MTIRKYVEPQVENVIKMPHDPDQGITFYITPGKNISILTRLPDKLGCSGSNKLVYGFIYQSGGKMRANKGSFVSNSAVDTIYKAMKAKKEVYYVDSWIDLCEWFLKEEDC